MLCASGEVRDFILREPILRQEFASILVQFRRKFLTRNSRRMQSRPATEHLSPQPRPLVNLQKVDTQMCQIRAAGSFERCFPCRTGLIRQPCDQICTNFLYTFRMQSRDLLQAGLAGVRTSHCRAFAIHKTLHTQAYAVHTEPYRLVKHIVGDLARRRFERNLRVLRDNELPPQRSEYLPQLSGLQQARCAAAKVHRVHGPRQLESQALCRSFSTIDLRTKSAHILRDAIGRGYSRGKVTEAALCAAKRHAHIHTELPHL